MKIDNRTNYVTADLRALAVRIAARELEPAERKRVAIRFVRSKRHIHGNAFVNGNRLMVYIPPSHLMTPERMPAVAMVLAHEMAHINGLHGGPANERRARATARYGFGYGFGYGASRGAYKEYYAWAADMPLRVQAPVRAPRATDDGKLAAAHAAIKRWDAKRKRAETALKKYRRRVKYYERKMAANREQS